MKFTVKAPAPLPAGVRTQNRGRLHSECDAGGDRQKSTPAQIFLSIKIHAALQGVAVSPLVCPLGRVEVWGFSSFHSLRRAWDGDKCVKGHSAASWCKGVTRRLAETGRSGNMAQRTKTVVGDNEDSCLRSAMA